MNTITKNALISVLLSSIILIMDMDLSYLQPSLKEVIQKITEKRKVEVEYQNQRYSMALPDDIYTSTRSMINLNMSSYVHSAISDMKPIVKTFPVSIDTSCRGSPVIRAP